MRAVACQRGTVFAEFLIAFPVVFVLFLAIIQLALLGAASLIVHHAAYRAARELSIVLDEDPANVDGAARMALRVKGQLPGNSPFSYKDNGPRMQRVEDAAFKPLAALAPPASIAKAWLKGTSPSLAEGALDPSWMRLGVALLYTSRATELNVGAYDGGGVWIFAGGQPVEVRVQYRYVCSVPVVNALICDSIVDVPGSEALQETLGFQLPRLVTLQASAKAAIHRAPYLYRSEHD